MTEEPAVTSLRRDSDVNNQSKTSGIGCCEDLLSIDGRDFRNHSDSSGI